ncbi:MAG: sulfotransferase family 2 domain-containing protein [Pseudomonadota bacterium]
MVDIRGIVERIGAQRFDRAVIISLKHKFVYFRVPKAANSSVKHYIYTQETIFDGKTIKDSLIHDVHYGPVVRPSMIGLDSDMLTEIMTSPDWYRFTVVRNPYSRILSAYLDRYHQNGSDLNKAVNAVRVKDGEDGVANLAVFSEFVRIVERDERVGRDMHVVAQHCENFASEIAMDILRQETLQADMDQFAKRIYGKDRADIGEKSPSKTSASDKVLKYFDEETLAAANRMYARDFDLFEYPLIPNLADLKATAA